MDEAEIRGAAGRAWRWWARDKQDTRASTDMAAVELGSVEYELKQLRRAVDEVQLGRRLPGEPAARPPLDPAAFGAKLRNPSIRARLLRMLMVPAEG